MTLFILAAGMGSRYGGLKQIDPFTENGEFIIDFSIYDAIKAGFDRVVFVIKEENYEAFKETVGQRVEDKIKVEYVFQGLNTLVPADKIPADRVKPWGTTHALLCAKDVLDDSFIVINADDFYGRDAFFKAAEFLKSQEEDSTHFCMVGYHLGNTLTDNGSVARGVCNANEEGFLDKIVERTKLFKEEGGANFTEDNGEVIHYSNDTIVSMNFWGFTPRVFKGLEEDFVQFINDASKEPLKSECLLPVMVDTLKKEGKLDVSVLQSADKWFGMTYRADREAVAEELKVLHSQGIYPETLRQ